jgi:MYXO-CTERM domain-containing protein
MPGTGGAVVVKGTGGAVVMPGTGGAVVMPGTGGAQGLGGTTSPATTQPSESSGCSISQGSHSAGLFLFVLGVGLAIFGRRKRS